MVLIDRHVILAAIRATHAEIEKRLGAIEAQLAELTSQTMFEFELDDDESETDEDEESTEEEESGSECESVCSCPARIGLDRDRSLKDLWRKVISERYVEDDSD